MSSKFKRTILNKDKRGESRGWQNVSRWYNRATDYGRGHYYHQHVVIPGVLRLLNLKAYNKDHKANILDLACGNGVLAKSLPKEVKYTGIDAATSLISQAKKSDHNPNHKYFIADVSKPLISPDLPNFFTHATIILALQNIKNIEGVFQNTSKLLTVNSKLLIILNHPMFRIPRQSSWGKDIARKIQYRRVDKYMSPMVIPIRANPSDPKSEETLSYHLPLSSYSNLLLKSGFLIESIEEWTSDKESQVGKTAKMENRARNEFPLFMAIVAIKI